MTEGAHRRRTTRRGRLSGVPLDQFRAELLGLVSAEVQKCAGIADVQREGFGAITVTVRLAGGEFASPDVHVSYSTARADTG